MKVNKIIKNDNIDFLELLKLLISKKKIILFVSLFFFSIGVFYSLIIKPTYKSTITFTVNSGKNSSNNQFQNLASIAGINLNSNTNILNPNYFPIIFENYNFKNNILETELEDGFSFKEFLQIKQDSNFLMKLFNLPFLLYNSLIEYIKTFSNSNEFKNVNSYQSNQNGYYSIEDELLFNMLNSLINIESNPKLNTINISVVTTKPLFSYIIANKTFELLQNRIIDTNQKSSLEVLRLNIRNFNNKKAEFLSIQDKLAKFKDSNQIISSSKFNNELSVIENEFNLVRSLYLELARQVELSKIEVSKDTPLFNILKDAYIPNKKFEPNRKLIVFTFTIVGLLLSLLYVFINYNFNSINNLFNKKLND